jgi:hypothetical protein
VTSSIHSAAARWVAHRLSAERLAQDTQGRTPDNVKRALRTILGAERASTLRITPQDLDSSMKGSHRLLGTR